ncbi:hypothetical protein DFR68_12028 [Nocardia mexicana]|uniref:Transcriptional regulator n=1 Tax=Nocardia mexicana TaxID=279262 RepID=A0A370GIR8_9NOCA|nr:hypothetical protein DFR68_12028 [Nocardia mexicana]
MAGILTEARGEIVTVDQLWPGRALQTEVWLPAITNMSTDSWEPRETLTLLDEFRLAGDAKTFFAVSGTPLTTVADTSKSARHLMLADDKASGRGYVTADFIDYLERDLAELRLLDDGHGGELVLRAVTHRLAQAVDLLNDSMYSAATGRRLLSVVGQMAQLAGWLGFDLGRHGFAQRTYLLGLRAAVSSGDKQLGALVLSCIAFQQTWRNRTHDAVSIMSTVRQGLRGGATPRVQALIAMREARAFATTGMHAPASAALDRALQALAHGAHENDPKWVYWMDSTVLTSEAGRCYLHLGDTKRAESQLAEGLAHLGENATRDRVLYGLSLALAHTRGAGGRQDLELACYEAEQVLPMLPEVGSARCRKLIETITTELRPHRTTSTVREFLDKFAMLKQAPIC